MTETQDAAGESQQQRAIRAIEAIFSGGDLVTLAEDRIAALAGHALLLGEGREGEGDEEAGDDRHDTRAAQRTTQILLRGARGGASLGELFPRANELSALGSRSAVAARFAHGAA